MKKRGRQRLIMLPPPVEMILLYAADGLAAWRGHVGRSGRPQTPGRPLWVPMLRELVESDQGLSTLRAMAEAGMQAWECPPDLTSCLEAAFSDITFRVSAVAVLHNLAATSPEKVTLPASRSRLAKRDGFSTRPCRVPRTCEPTVLT